MFSEDSRAVHPRLGWWSVIIIQGVTVPYFNSPPPSTHRHTHPHVYTDISPLTIFFAFLASFSRKYYLKTDRFRPGNREQCWSYN